MNLEDKLDLMLLEHEILEKLFIGDTTYTIEDKHGVDILLALTGTMDCDYYKWDIDRCEARAKILIDQVVFLENHTI